MRAPTTAEMAVAFLKAARAGVQPDLLRPSIDGWIEWISRGQMRLSDGTLARNRPLANTLWLDDLYMSVPALAQGGPPRRERSFAEHEDRPGPVL